MAQPLATAAINVSAAKRFIVLSPALGEPAGRPLSDPLPLRIEPSAPRLGTDGPRLIGFFFLAWTYLRQEAPRIFGKSGKVCVDSVRRCKTRLNQALCLSRTTDPFPLFFSELVTRSSNLISGSAGPPSLHPTQGDLKSGAGWTSYSANSFAHRHGTRYARRCFMQLNS